MNCLVTGAAGYIGGYLVEKLLSLGYTVIAVDRYRRTRPETIFGKGNKNLIPITIDILKNTEKLHPYKNKLDIVFHLAGRNNTDDAREHPMMFHDGNVTVTVRILELARLLGVKKFIYAASASCYGVPLVLPTPETYPASPQYIYSMTKYLGEAAVLHWGLIYKLPVISLRLFSVYGPRPRKGLGSGLFISKFLDAIREKRPIVINGDGTQSRDMVYISDVVSALVTAAEVKEAKGVFNVGTGKSTPLNAIIKIIGYDKISRRRQPKGEAQQTQADISKIREELHWSPKVSLKVGLAKTLAEDKGK